MERPASRATSRTEARSTPSRRIARQAALGGLTYAGLHFWDAWAVFTSPESTVLSVIFLVFTYLGPGMFKSYLTLRTGHAWVDVWAYHAFAPHTLIDTPHIVEEFRLK